MTSILKSLGAVALFVLAIWGLGLLIGFEMNLLATLLLSLGLTFLLNLVTGAFSAARSS